MTPFIYPPTPHVRRHGPQGYADYARYLPWLRDEFAFRCVFCLRRQQWGRAAAELEVDHFQAVAQRPELDTAYANLLLACRICNVLKADRTVPDPCLALTAATVTVDLNGTIRGHTTEARRLIRVLALDAPPATEFRVLWNSIVMLARQFDPELFQRLLGFPDDLPDLRRLRPPGGNIHPEGVEQSWYACRERGELPETY